MIKCINCGREIETGIVISCDGDFVCNEDCRMVVKAKNKRLNEMSDDEFESWLWGE